MATGESLPTLARTFLTEAPGSHRPRDSAPLAAATELMEALLSHLRCVFAWNLREPLRPLEASGSWSYSCSLNALIGWVCWLGCQRRCFCSSGSGTAYLNGKGEERGPFLLRSPLRALQL